jgi:hypothetical protein
MFQRSIALIALNFNGGSLERTAHSARFSKIASDLLEFRHSDSLEARKYCDCLSASPGLLADDIDPASGTFLSCLLFRWSYRLPRFRSRYSPSKSIGRK